MAARDRPAWSQQGAFAFARSLAALSGAAGSTHLLTLEQMAYSGMLPRPVLQLTHPPAAQMDMQFKDIVDLVRKNGSRFTLKVVNCGVNMVVADFGVFPDADIVRIVQIMDSVLASTRMETLSQVCQPLLPRPAPT
jgi:hypothetical protein